MCFFLSRSRNERIFSVSFGRASATPLWWYGLETRTRPSACTCSSTMVSMMMSHSAERYWMGLTIQAISRPTPSCLAIARASSIWNPGGSPLRLAKGSALGCAHRLTTPRISIEPSGRGEGPGISQTAATASRTAVRPNPPRRRSLRRLGQGADVGDDRPDLVIVEALAESRHTRRLALLDLAADEFVALVGAGELGTAASNPAATLMAPATRCCEQSADVRIDRRGRVRCRRRSCLRAWRDLSPRGLLRMDGNGEHSWSQGQSRDRQIPELIHSIDRIRQMRQDEGGPDRPRPGHHSR